MVVVEVGLRWWWWVVDWVVFVGPCLWLGSGSGSDYICVCGFVLVVGIGWVEAGLAWHCCWRLLLAVAVVWVFFVGCHWFFLLLDFLVC